MNQIHMGRTDIFIVALLWFPTCLLTLFGHCFHPKLSDIVSIRKFFL